MGILCIRLAVWIHTASRRRFEPKSAAFRPFERRPRRPGINHFRFFIRGVVAFEAPMTYDLDVLSARVRRARSATGKGIKYKLGKGGFYPQAPFPDGTPIRSHAGATWRYGKECDCSGFVAWVLGMRRDQINADKWWSKLLPWIETTMVYRDATGPQRVFVRTPKPVPGCLVVYGDRGTSQGHIGVVTRLVGYSGFDVVDCSSGMSRSTGDAIHERDGAFFVRSGAIYCVLKQDVR